MILFIHWRRIANDQRKNCMDIFFDLMSQVDLRIRNMGKNQPLIILSFIRAWRVRL